MKTEKLEKQLMTHLQKAEDVAKKLQKLGYCVRINRTSSYEKSVEITKYLFVK